MQEAADPKVVVTGRSSSSSIWRCVIPDALLAAVLTSSKDLNIECTRTLGFSVEQELSLGPVRVPLTDTKYILHDLAEYTLWNGSKQQMELNLVGCGPRGFISDRDICQTFGYMGKCQYSLRYLSYLRTDRYVWIYWRDRAPTAQETAKAKYDRIWYHQWPKVLGIP